MGILAKLMLLTPLISNLKERTLDSLAMKQEMHMGFLPRCNLSHQARHPLLSLDYSARTTRSSVPLFGELVGESEIGALPYPNG